MNDIAAYTSLSINIAALCYIGYHGYRKTIAWLRSRDKPVITALMFPDGGYQCRHWTAGNCVIKDCQLLHRITNKTRLKEVIESAEDSIDVCMFVLTCAVLLDALIAVHKRGVKVRIVCDNMKISGSNDNILHSGIKIRVDNSPETMHHKFIIIDKAIILTGSFNWTASGAAYNRENVLISNEPHVAAAYRNEFEKLWEMFEQSTELVYETVESEKDLRNRFAFRKRESHKGTFQTITYSNNITRSGIWMYADLLLALSGHPGTIFVRDSGGEFHISEGTPCLAPHEAFLLNRILKIASCYHSLSNFTREYGNIIKIKRNPHPANGGQYTLQLCKGITRGLLPYRDTILTLDRLIREEPCMPLSKLQVYLDKYQILFPYLVRITNRVATSDIKGCDILNLIHEQSECGIPFVKEAIQELHQSCKSVFYEQLLCWVLCGQVKDPFNEFFIAEISDADQSDMMGGLLSKFGIVPEMVPVYLPHSVVRTIHFIGCAVLVFTKLRGVSNPLRKEDEEFFIDSIKKLKSKSRFCAIEFEHTVCEMRERVAEQLYSLLMTEGQLLETLELFKDFFLMGRGELFLIFIDTADELMNPKSNKLTDSDINRLFRIAHTRLGSSSEDCPERLGFYFDKPAKPDVTRSGSLASQASSVETNNDSKTRWYDLSLTYDAPWPTHILLTPDVVQEYNTVFKFLLKVKRCQLALQTAWSESMRLENQFSQEVLKLRSDVAYIINNIQYYLHVDVLEANYDMLISEINKTRDFEQIKSSHDKFVSALRAWTFQSNENTAVRDFLDKMIGIAFTVSNMIMNPSEDNSTAIANVTRNYQLCLTVMFRMLEKGASMQHNSLMNQLLIRLDYNSFFSVTMKNRRQAISSQMGRFRLINSNKDSNSNGESPVPSSSEEHVTSPV